MQYLRTRHTCELCGKYLEQNTVGRPRVYHDECRKILQLLSWLEDLLSNIRATSQKRNELRSRLWYIANTLNGKSHDSSE